MNKKTKNKIELIKKLIGMNEDKNYWGVGCFGRFNYNSEEYLCLKRIKTGDYERNICPICKRISDKLGTFIGEKK